MIYFHTKSDFLDNFLLSESLCSGSMTLVVEYLFKSIHSKLCTDINFCLKVTRFKGAFGVAVLLLFL